ncbi:MAG TPA: M48 family metallopeptidase [Armatimonadota bacterium]
MPISEDSAADFSARVQRFELMARMNPRGFRRQIALFAGFGYAFLLCCLVFSLGLFVGVAMLGVQTTGYINQLAFKGLVLLADVVFLLALLLILSLLIAIVRVFWLRTPAPVGLPLQRNMAPRLFSLLDQLGAPLEPPRIDALIIHGEFDITVAQIPRLGLLGASRNYLLIGLPLLQSVSPEQFRALLAHALSQVSGSQGKFGLWGKHIGQSWQQVTAALAQSEKIGLALVAAFAHWYGARFAVYAFTLCRFNDYLADQYAKFVVGPEQMANSLLAMNLMGRYWRDVFVPSLQTADARASGQAAAAFTAWQDQHTVAFAEGFAEPRLCEALGEKTGYSASQPCLADRLRLLGYAPEMPGGYLERGVKGLPLPGEIDVTALRYYLGPTAEHAVLTLDRLCSRRLQQEATEKHSEAKTLMLH